MDQYICINVSVSFFCSCLGFFVLHIRRGPDDQIKFLFDLFVFTKIIICPKLPVQISGNPLFPVRFFPLKRKRKRKIRSFKITTDSSLISFPNTVFTIERISSLLISSSVFFAHSNFNLSAATRNSPVPHVGSKTVFLHANSCFVQHSYPVRFFVQKEGTVLQNKPHHILRRIVDSSHLPNLLLFIDPGKKAVQLLITICLPLIFPWFF